MDHRRQGHGRENEGDAEARDEGVLAAERRCGCAHSLPELPQEVALKTGDFSRRARTSPHASRRCAVHDIPVAVIVSVRPGTSLAAWEVVWRCFARNSRALITGARDHVETP